MLKSLRAAAAALSCLAASPLLAQDAPTPSPDQQARVERLAVELAGELSTACPMAGPGDQEAFDRCRKTLFGDSALRRNLRPFVHWGRQKNSDPTVALKDTNLTQFAPDVLTGMYIPLFMFDGTRKVSFHTGEKLWRVELGAGFRNRLAPGLFPYPFWHEADKWGTYENARSLLIWVDPKSEKIAYAQFTRNGDAELRTSKVDQGPHDGRWMWTDATGRTQPQVSLFDGLFRADNPYMVKLEDSYRQLALSLREGQCMQCHVPNNPNKMKRLVLLQTPLHAAAEIKRVMDTVRRDRMPLDDYGIEEALPSNVKSVLMERGSAFETLIEAAKAWEADMALKADMKN